MMKNIKFLILAMMILFPLKVFAAVGCDLNDPDRDVKRFFPESSGYKSEYISLTDKKIPLDVVERRLGDKFTGLFETAEVPYTLYSIYKGKDIIGYIHGVNQKSTYGGMQVFIILDKNGVIRNFYFQKLTSKAAKELRSPEFAKQFIGLSLKDFDKYDVAKSQGLENTIKNPVPEVEADFRAAMRGVKKNLILMDEFVFNPNNKK